MRERERNRESERGKRVKELTLIHNAVNETIMLNNVTCESLSQRDDDLSTHFSPSKWGLKYSPETNWA